MEQSPRDRENAPQAVRQVETAGDRLHGDPEQSFWRQFVEASTPQVFCQLWLPLQCRMLDGVRCAMVLMGPADKGPFTPVAVWPDAKMDMGHLTGAAERSLKERRGLLLERHTRPPADKPFPEAFHVAYPIEIEDKLHGTVVLGVDAADPTAVQRIMRQLHWGIAWLEVLVRRGDALASEQIARRLKNVLDLTTSAVEHESAHASAMAFVTHMADRLECHRVSIGHCSRGHARVMAMSHSAEFGRQSNLVRDIEAAMDEAIDQRSVIVYPAPEESAPLVNRAHRNLDRRHDSGPICTVPIEVNGEFRMGLTLERPGSRPFTPRQVDWLETAAALALVIFFSVYTIDYRVTAPTILEGVIQRVVAAPFNGYIQKSAIRPGDLVAAGDLLAVLDDRDLKLERVKWSTEKEQYIKQYNEALAKRDRAQIRILRAKMGQADAQLALLEEQLARCLIVAPFDGVIISGDLSQSLGTPVERGEVLFEVTPLNAYRAIIEVDKRDIGHIEMGQLGELVLPSMPGDAFPFVVEKITPVSTAKEGRNYFRVEGQLDQASDRLRPGMEGIGKITIDRRKLIWVWTHRAVDWFRLQMWRWRP